MKVTIDGNIIDTEMIYSVTEVEIDFDHKNFYSFRINILNGNSIVIGSYFREHFERFTIEKMFSLQTVCDERGYPIFEDDDYKRSIQINYEFKEIYNHLKEKALTDDEIVQYIKSLPYTDDGKLDFFTFANHHRYRIYLFDTFAIKKLNEIRDKLLDVWEPNKDKFLKIS